MSESVLYIVGILIMVLGIALSIGLHEFGHLIPAKKFGVRVPNWAIGFGPKLFGRKVGETEYSVRLIPLGGFITLIGMYPPEKPGNEGKKRPFANMISAARDAHSEHVQPGDESRMFYQLPAYKRIIVMFGGPLMNLVLGVAMISSALVFVGQPQRVNQIESVVGCVEQMVDPKAECGQDSKPTPAVLAGLEAGDKIIEVNGQKIAQTTEFFKGKVDSSNHTYWLRVQRGSKQVELSISPAIAALPYVGSDGKVAVDANGDYLLKDRGYLGVRWATTRVPVGVDVALRASGEMTAQTMGFIVQFPVAVYDSVSSLFADKPRAGDGAISIVGIGQIAGEANANQNATLADRLYLNLMLLGSLNLALFAFNMIPLPPLDGGHIAGGIYEYLKRGAYRLVRKPDPGPVDTALMAPVSGIMFILLLLAGVAMIVVDIVNPVGL